MNLSDDNEKFLEPLPLETDLLVSLQSLFEGKKIKSTEKKKTEINL